MHIWWRNKISQLSKVEKGKDLVGVKGGGESNLCIQLPAAWETEREREQRKEGGKRGREGACVKADKDGKRERGGSGGEDERWMVDTKLSWCVEGNGLSLHWEGHQTDKAWFNWYPDWAFLSANRHIMLVCNLWQSCRLPKAFLIFMRGLLRVFGNALLFLRCRSLSQHVFTTVTRTLYLPLTHTAASRHAGSPRQTGGLTKSRHAALNLPWHFLIDFL